MELENPKSKIQHLRLMIEAQVMDPNEILSRKALTMPHRTIIDSEQNQIETLNQALKQAIIQELHR